MSNLSPARAGRAPTDEEIILRADGNWPWLCMLLVAKFVAKGESVVITANDMRALAQRYQDEQTALVSRRLPDGLQFSLIPGSEALEIIKANSHGGGTGLVGHA